MEILRNRNNNQNILLTQTQDFKTDLGWTEEAEKMDNEVLASILNLSQNYETVRYIHEPYNSAVSGIYQTDIWYYFYFYNSLVFEQHTLIHNQNFPSNYILYHLW